MYSIILLYIKEGDLIMASKKELESIDMSAVPEFKGLRLEPIEVRFIMNYISSSCGLDVNKAYRATIGEEVFKTLSKSQFYSRARAIRNKDDVKTAIGRLLTREVAEKKEEIIPNLLNDLTVAASYDPALIIDDDGDLRGGAMSDIPQKYRRAVIEGISVKYWGKDCQVRTREVKLASKSKARQQLMDVLKILDNLQMDNVEAGQTFTVNIGTQNIEGAPTAMDLFKKSIVENIQNAEVVEEE